MYGKVIVRQDDRIIPIYSANRPAQLARLQLRTLLTYVRRHDSRFGQCTVSIITRRWNVDDLVFNVRRFALVALHGIIVDFFMTGCRACLEKSENLFRRYCLHKPASIGSRNWSIIFDRLISFCSSKFHDQTTVRSNNSKINFAGTFWYGHWNFDPDYQYWPPILIRQTNRDHRMKELNYFSESCGWWIDNWTGVLFGTVFNRCIYISSWHLYGWPSF